MELAQLLDQIRVQCSQSRFPGPGERRGGLVAVSTPLPGVVEPGHSGASAASRTQGETVDEVSTSLLFSLFLNTGCLVHHQRDNHTVMSSFGSAHNKSILTKTYDHIYLSVCLFSYLSVCVCIHVETCDAGCSAYCILWQSSLWSTKIITLIYLNNFEYLNELQSKNTKVRY